MQGDPALADFADVDGLGLAGLFARANLVLNAIALIEGLEAVHLDLREVHEQVHAVVLRDEALTLLGVKPLNSTFRHFKSSFLSRAIARG